MSAVPVRATCRPDWWHAPGRERSGPAPARTPSRRDRALTTVEQWIATTDAEGATDRGAGGFSSDEPRDRGCAFPEREDRRVEPVKRLPEAIRALAYRTRAKMTAAPTPHDLPRLSGCTLKRPIQGHSVRHSFASDHSDHLILRTGMDACGLDDAVSQTAASSVAERLSHGAPPADRGRLSAGFRWRQSYTPTDLGTEIA